MSNMSDPGPQIFPEFWKAVIKYLDRQDPGVGLVFLFFCSIYIVVFIINVTVFKTLFGFTFGKKPMKTYQDSSSSAFFSVINLMIISILLICFGFHIDFFVKYGVIDRGWLAWWSLFLVMFTRPLTEYYAFYIVIETKAKYNSQYKFHSNAEYAGSCRMFFWGAFLVAKEIVLYVCHGYISGQYPDPKYEIAAQVAAFVLVCAFVSFHVLLFESVWLQWKMYRAEIVTAYKDKLMFSQIMLMAIFKIALILVVLLAMLTGSDTFGLIQCYYTTDILVVATVFMLAEVLSAERNSEGKGNVDPESDVEESEL